jgi:lipoyl(octanoyl) transferase
VASLRFLHVGDGKPVPYHLAWDIQRELHAARAEDRIDDTVILLEHEPVFTAGRRTQPQDRPGDGSAVVEVDRGGKITWHGPGQLTAYPIVKLPDGVHVVDHVRRLESAIIAVCADLGAATARVPGRSGVWIPSGGTAPDRKVAAIGLRVARGVSMHGFAINCDCDLSAFGRIIPCGITDAAVTSLSVELARPVTVAEVVPLVQRQLAAALSPTEPLDVEPVSVALPRSLATVGVGSSR